MLTEFITAAQIISQPGSTLLGTGYKQGRTGARQIVSQSEVVVCLSCEFVLTCSRVGVCVVCVCLPPPFPLCVWTRPGLPQSVKVCILKYYFVVCLVVCFTHLS